MPLTPIVTPTYPAVPNQPGVPVIPRIVGTVNQVVSTAVAVTSRIISLLDPPVWGVFDSSGNKVLEPDAIKNIDYRSERRVPDYPIEEGGFGSYNKVSTPFESRMTLMKTGTVQDKMDFIEQLQSMIDDLELYTIITPEDVFDNVNLLSVSYDRTIRSVQMVEFDVSFKEIRIVQAGQFSNTADPSGASPENAGTVAPTTATKTQTNAVATKPAIPSESSGVHDKSTVSDGASASSGVHDK